MTADTFVSIPRIGDVRISAITRVTRHTPSYCDMFVGDIKGEWHLAIYFDPAAGLQNKAGGPLVAVLGKDAAEKFLAQWRPIVAAQEHYEDIE